MSLLLALPLMLAQIGPFTPPGGAPVSPLPPELRDRPQSQNRKPRPQASPPPAEITAEAPSTGTTECLKHAAADPTAAVDQARAWRDGTADVERAAADLCLGTALSELQRFGEAEAAFLDGRQASEGAPALRARLGAMAANAALATGAAARALGFLDTAKADLGEARDGPLSADIALDRARALVALERLPEADAALTEARTLAPQSAEAWLLSATLSRRMDKLADAQARIETAGRLAPADAAAAPEIGLEAGVIAMLSGREDAARKSWRSVVATAPRSAAAESARRYLVQIGDTPAAAPASGR
ncbi:MAG TPA: hypothetical protein VF440_00335 [Novosphingobium sp.]